MSSARAEPSTENDALLASLRKYLQASDRRQQVDPNQFMVPWFNHLELLEAHKDQDGTGSLVWRFPVLKEYLQAFSTYAGGAQAAAHDTCTGWTLLTISKPGYWASLGTSRTLNMSYFKAAREGDILKLEAKIINIGSRMAMIRGKLFRESDGQIISTSEHHLYNNDAAARKL